VLLLLATGCAPDAEPDHPGGESNVDVDTPELRQLKQEIGIETCVPGTGTDGPLPDLTLACLGGGPDVDLASLQGPLVVNLWYAACGPCEAEMPALQDFYEQYGDQVPVLGITKDVFPEYALELARSTGARYPQLADPGDEIGSTEIRPRGYPTFAFVDAEGELTLAAGGIDSVTELVDLVEKNLGITL
jgi:thiol-disulfide isomerase/thioredoxin